MKTKLLPTIIISLFGIIFACRAEDAPSLVQVSISTESGNLAFSLNQKPVSRSELSELLARAAAIDKAMDVTVNFSPEITVHSVVDILSDIQRLGLSQVKVHMLDTQGRSISMTSFSINEPIATEEGTTDPGPDVPFD